MARLPLSLLRAAGLGLLGLALALPASAALFPPASGAKVDPSDPAVVAIEVSLAGDGSPIDPEVDALFKRAVAANRQQDFAGAARGFGDSLQRAAQKKLALSPWQFDQLLVGLAYALADQRRLTEALDLWLFRQTFWDGTPGWRDRLPPGLAVADENDPTQRRHFAAQNHSERMISLQLLGRIPEAHSQLTEAAALYREQSEAQELFGLYRTYAQNSAALGLWNEAVAAGDEFLDQIMPKKEGAEVAFTMEAKEPLLAILRLRLTGLIQTKRFVSALEASDQLLAYDRTLGETGDWADQDQEVNMALRRRFR